MKLFLQYNNTEKINTELYLHKIDGYFMDRINKILPKIILNKIDKQTIGSTGDILFNADKENQYKTRCFRCILWICGILVFKINYFYRISVDKLMPLIRKSIGDSQ